MQYFKIAKKRKKSHQERREAIEKQLGYIKKNLSYIEELIKEGSTKRKFKEKTE